MERIFEAGAAFGSGRHPSTSLTLAAMAELAGERSASDAVLDYGCGSGILLLAAAMSPHRRLVGADRDAMAVATARRNLRANGVEAEIHHARRPDHPAIAAAGPYALIASNLLAELHVPMLAAFAARLAPGGTLLLSGILAWQEEPLLAAVSSAGLRPRFKMTRDEWILLGLAAHVEEADPQVEIAGEQGEQRRQP